MCSLEHWNEAYKQSNPIEQIRTVIVYQTKSEDRRLMVMDDTSVGAFLVGLGLGFVYLRKWGIAHAIVLRPRRMSTRGRVRRLKRPQ